MHEEEDLDWETLSKQVPNLPRGWFELSRCDREDRIDFVRGHWTANLPYAPKSNATIQRFFEEMEDIGLFLTQRSYDDPLIPQMVYSLEKTFFHGDAPATDEEMGLIEGMFDPYPLPSDYLAFLRIHSGFGKATDTGVSGARSLHDLYEDLQELLAQRPPITLGVEKEVVVGERLIPFYQSFGMDSYQCFYADWYPQAEMGNLYYSGIEHTLPDYRSGPAPDKLAFATFLDWLAFYLEFVGE